MSVGDLYQVTTSADFLGQVCDNVYWYTQVAGSASNSAELLAEALLGGVTQVVRGAQHQDYNVSRIRSVNWTNPIDFYADDGIVQPGLVTVGEPAPSFVQFSFTLVQPYPGVKSGSKRFAGVPEFYMNGNTEGIPSLIAIGIENALSQVLVNGGLSFKPVVLRRVIGGVPQNSEMGNPPFQTWDVLNVNYRGISSQRSRLNL